MPPPTLTRRQLNRALLARQLLLERSSLSIAEAVEQVGGLQTQYAPSGYVGLWTRLAGFERDDLTAALEDRRVVQATLMRGDHPPRLRARVLAVRDGRPAGPPGVGDARVTPRADAADDRAPRAELREALADGPRSVAELGGLGGGFVGNVGLWVDLVRVPPSGHLGAAARGHPGAGRGWVGPCDATEEQGLEHLVRAYLRAFGPAPLKDIATLGRRPG